MREKVVVFAMLCIVVAAPGRAQNKQMGTSSATELLIPVGARDLALGGASIATSRGAEAIHWNPAGLARITHSAEGMFSSMNYLGDIGVNYGSVAASFSSFGVIAFSVKSLAFGDIPLTTNDDPEGRAGKLFSPTFVTLGFTYARTLTDAIGAGINIKLVTERIDRVSATGIAVDVGVQYAGLGGVQGLNLGVAIKNIGPQTKFDGPGLYGSAARSDGRRPEQTYKSEAASFELPSLFEIGLGYQHRLVENVQVELTSSFTNKNLGLDEYRAGGEIAYDIEGIQLFGRAGLNLTPQADAKEQQIFGSTFGVGLFYPVPGLDITIDYAYRTVAFFDPNTVLSFKLGF